MNLNTLKLNTILRVRACAFFVAAALLVALPACGKASDSADSHEAALQVAGFESYVARFESDAAANGRTIQVSDLIIRFGTVDAEGESGGRGVCEFQPGATPVITLSQAAWDTSNDAEREQLVFHELGHCVLQKRHVGGVSAQGIPRSLMNPYRIDGSVYLQNKAYYLSTFFGE